MLFAELVAIFDPAFCKKKTKKRKNWKVTLSLVVLMSSCAPAIFPEAQNCKAAYTLRFSVPHFQFTLLWFLCTESAGHVLASHLEYQRSCKQGFSRARSLAAFQSFRFFLFASRNSLMGVGSRVTLVKPPRMMHVKFEGNPSLHATWL